MLRGIALTKRFRAARLEDKIKEAGKHINELSSSIVAEERRLITLKEAVKTVSDRHVRHELREGIRRVAMQLKESREARDKERAWRRILQDRLNRLKLPGVVAKTNSPPSLGAWVGDAPPLLSEIGPDDLEGQ